MGGTRVVVGGVSGSGKTTVGSQVADRLGIDFLDADDLHSSQAVEQMHQGVGLTDVQRDEWMDRVLLAIHDHDNVVLACSALRRSHRDRLRSEVGAHIFLLDAPRAELHERLIHRHGHFFDPDLLDDQLATQQMPTPEETITVLDGSRSIEELVEDIVTSLEGP